MEILVIAIWGIVIAGTLAGWVVFFRVFLPAYRRGGMGKARPWLPILPTLLSYETMLIFVYIGGGHNTAATMLSVLWCIATLAWVTLTAAGATRKQVFDARTAAANMPTPEPEPVRPIRWQPWPGGSVTVDEIENMEVQT